VQLHWDDWGTPGYVEVARHLADLQRRGLVGAVGVCNWDVPRLLELIQAGVTPATNQVGARGGGGAVLRWRCKLAAGSAWRAAGDLTHCGLHPPPHSPLPPPNPPRCATA
jgi:hypothetical protein